MCFNVIWINVDIIQKEGRKGSIDPGSTFCFLPTFQPANSWARENSREANALISADRSFVNKGQMS